MSHERLSHRALRFPQPQPDDNAVHGRPSDHPRAHDPRVLRRPPRPICPRRTRPPHREEKAQEIDGRNLQHTLGHADVLRQWNSARIREEP